MNQDSSGGAQEMELTDETKAYLAQLLQQHSGAGPDTITHIQLGDQTLQIQRQEEEEDTEEMKFDSSADLEGSGVVAVSSSAESVVTEQSAERNALEGMVVTAGAREMVNDAPAEEDPSMASMAGVQVVEMEDGQLGRIIHMDESQMLEMAAGGNPAIAGGQIFQMEGGQVIHLDHAQLMAMGGEDGQVVVSAADLVAAVQEQHQQQQDDVQQQQQHQQIVLPSLTVTKRRGIDGQIVVEVEGEDGKLVGLEQMVASQEGGQPVDGAGGLKNEIEENHGLQIAIADQVEENAAITGHGIDTGNRQLLQIVESNPEPADMGSEAVKNENLVEMADGVGEEEDHGTETVAGEMGQIIHAVEQPQAVMEGVHNQTTEVALQESYIVGGDTASVPGMGAIEGEAQALVEASGSNPKELVLEESVDQPGPD